MDRNFEAAEELANLIGALEDWRSYLAGPCTRDCENELGELAADDYDGHRHWTDEYERVRGEVVMLNRIISGDYEFPKVLCSIGEGQR